MSEEFDNETPLLMKEVWKFDPYHPIQSEYQFLHEDLRSARIELSKYKEATKDIVKTSGCGCITLNGVLLKWCGDHYL